jgi:hypothetical protein
VKKVHGVNKNNLIYLPREAPQENMVSWNLTILIWAYSKGSVDNAEKTCPEEYYTVVLLSIGICAKAFRILPHLIPLAIPCGYYHYYVYFIV